MAETEITVLKPEILHQLIKKKLMKASLPEEAANEAANHLVFADACGIHSHGAVRVDYYAERHFIRILRLKKQGLRQGSSMEIMAWDSM